jgi:hypothetical protein
LNSTDLIISSGPVDDGLDEQAEVVLDAELRSWVVDASQHGHRLDRTLAELVPEFSRSYLQQLIVLRAVTLNGTTITKPAARVKVADAGTIELRPTPQSQAFKPEPMALDVCIRMSMCWSSTSRRTWSFIPRQAIGVAPCLTVCWRLMPPSRTCLERALCIGWIRTPAA